MTVGQALRWAQNELDEISGEDATADARAFVCAVLDVEPQRVLSMLQSPMQGKQMTLLRQMVVRRKGREPAQYITGRTSFMGIEILCDPRALIPRFETELLAMEAQQTARMNGLKKALDLCTGSGCLAVALALFGLEVSASDASEDAILLAQENAKRHNAPIVFYQGNLFAALPEDERFDLIASNPPYVKSAEIDWLDEEIGAHEPHIALDGGEDGLHFYRRIAEDSPEFLREGGYLLLEVGDGQAAAVVSLLERHFTDITISPDMRGIERIVKGRRKD